MPSVRRPHCGCDLVGSNPFALTRHVADTPIVLSTLRPDAKPTKAMATTTVEIDLSEASDLADFIGIEYDLRSAREFAQMLLRVHAQAGPNWRQLDPLTTATLVRYVRPFAKGVRSRLGDEALAALPPEQRATHARFLAIRDKHVAHSVNAFEENRVVARYQVERVKDEGITAIEARHVRIVGLGVDDLNSIVEITSVILGHVEARIREEKAKVLAIVRRKPIEEVLAGAKAPAGLSISDPSKRRPP